MDSLAVICIVVGTLTIVVRGPLLVAPRATLRFYARLIFSTNARCRVFGVVVATLAIALLLLPFERSMSGFLHAVGWVVAAMALWPLVLPDGWLGFWRPIFSFLEHSVDDAIVRILGLLAVVVGVALIYVGIYVV